MDREVFEQHIWPLRDKLYRIAAYVTGNAETAREVVQEVLTRCWEKRTSLHNVQNWEAFLVRSVKNECIDSFKRNGKEYSYDRDSFVRIADNTASEVEPEEEGNTLAKVKKAVSLLPEKQRVVMLLRDIEGYDMDEIEEITGLQQGNIRVTLSRARSKVKATLQKTYSYAKTGN